MSLYKLTRLCEACSLRGGCNGAVPAVGSGRIMLVGEAPGRNEDKQGVPFTGDAGRYLDSLLTSAGLNRSQVIITNTVKCRPLRNRTPTKAEADFCADHWLDLEVELYKPEIIVPMGKVAIQHFLGEGTVEHVHGIPVQQDGRIILPVYHPAAGFYDTSLMRAIQSDFQVLGQLHRGETVECPVDTLVPEYAEATPTNVWWLMHGGADRIAIDTEIVDNNLWSFQASDTAGTGRFFDAETWGFIESAKLIVHNYLFDSRWVYLPDNTDDTMLMAYLLGLPQGLKELSWRLCGMQMSSYSETISPWRLNKSLDYLDQATGVEWPEPPEISNTVWNKTNQCMEVQSKRPQHINRKIRRILADVIGGKTLKDGPVDAWTRWHQIDERERAEVEKELGPMPDASLADVPRDQAVYYSTRDADATLRVYNKLWPMIKDRGLGYIYSIDRQTLPVAREMQEIGITVNVPYLRQLGLHYLEQMEAISEEIFKALGCRFNPNSDNDLRRVFYNELRYKPTKFTPTGLPSVKSEELAKIDHPGAKLVEEYRHLAHLKHSFCDALPKNVGEDGRIHTTINVTRTETGRWSMKNPNLQQIPNRTEEGRAIRKAFTGGPSTTLVALDYSQIEMRVAAHLAQCQSMIQLFQEGRDIHTETAAQIFGIPLDQVTSQQRYPTKTMGFGVIYNLTAHGLYNQMQGEGLDWTENRCAEFIDWYYELRPELRTWQEQIKQQARIDGYVSDMFGRIRYIPELLCPIDRYRAAGERQAINMPVQSSAQGILKLAMGRMYQGSPPVPYAWLLQIHDEIIVEVLDSGVNEYVGWAKNIMESAVHLSVPVIAEAKVGKNWGEMRDLTTAYDSSRIIST